jgi:predicted TIM-barrel fold metal-dependent hydrolase
LTHERRRDPEEARMIIDGHVHVWPDKIAKRALGSPGDGLQRFGDGTVASAVKTMRAAGVDRSVCLAVADTPERLESANRFVGSLDPEHFIGFGSVHPERTPEDNVASLRENGLRGVKVHPLFQGFALDDRRLYEILGALEGEFAAVFHVGPEHPGDPRGALATPAMIRDIARNFPRLDVVAAHLGGYHAFDEALEAVNGLDVHLDTSWPPGIAALDPGRVRAAIASHGPERVVFATDWPMADPATEIASIRALGFSDEDTDAILGGNFARLLGLDVPAGAA